MSQITSNLFDMNIKSENVTDIKYKDFINVPTEIIKTPSSIPLSQTFLNELSSILLACKGYKGIKFNEINIDYLNFSEYHYEIMNNRYLVVIYDKDNNLFKYLTHSGKVFITSDIKVIQIINSTPYPYKVSIGYIPLIDHDKYKSLQLLSNVLFNMNSNNTLSIIKAFIKADTEIQMLDEYHINYYLFTIYPRIEQLINKYNYWKYINLEQEVFNILNTNLPYEVINYDYLNFLKDDYTSQVKELSEEINLGNTDLANEMKFLESIYNNTEFYVTCNKELVSILKYDKLADLIEKLETINFIDYILSNKSLPKCTLSSSIGNISSSVTIKENINFSTKNLIKCSYKDLYFKVFAFFSHNKELKSIVSLDKNIVEELLKNEFSNEELKFKTFLVENYIKALNLGYESDEDILLYYEKELKTLITDEDFLTVKSLYNDKLIVLKDILDKYNSSDVFNIKSKLIYHSNLKPMGVAIYDKIRLIQKNLITELNMYCNEFNLKNKSKMDIAYFDDNYLYLIVDEEALNTAFDMLTRVMPMIFSNNCPNIVGNCIIEVL